MAKIFSETHEWIELQEGNNGLYRVGISNHAQELLGDVVFVELPQVGDSIKKGEEIGVIESVKAASNVYSPVSGEIIEINEELENSPDLINTSAEDEGWLYTIKLSDETQIGELSLDEEYREKLES